MSERIALTQVGNWRVSTISIQPDPSPLAKYETIVFYSRGKHSDDVCERGYSNVEDAMKGHFEITNDVIAHPRNYRKRLF